MEPAVAVPESADKTEKIKNKTDLLTL